MHAAAGGAARPPSSHTHNLLGLVSSWPGWRRAPWALVGGVGVGVESTTGHVLPPASPRPRLELACGAGEPVPPVEESFVGDGRAARRRGPRRHLRAACRGNKVPEPLQV